MSYHNEAESKAFNEEWQEAVENARQFAKGWKYDEGDGILSAEELSQHSVMGCLVCKHWDRWDNMEKRPGQHEIVTEEGRV